MNSNELLDAFKTQFGITTDADLAYVFDVPRPQVANWRTGHRPIPSLIKWRLLDHLGYAWVKDAVPYFVPEDEHQLFKARDCERMQERAEARKAQTEKKEIYMAIDWQDQITKLCNARGWSLRTLAGDMGVSVSYLSDVMTAKRKPSLALKIKLASRIGYDKTSDLLEDLLPADAAEAWAEWEAKQTKALGRQAEARVEKMEAKVAKKPRASKSKRTDASE